MAKTHRGAMKAFKEFERRFARLPEREQRLMGADKVLLFVRSIDQAEWEAIEIELGDDDGVNGLTEDWLEVERVCHRLDAERSGRAKGKARDDAPSQQEEGARRRESVRLSLEARTEEAYADLKVMVEEEEKSWLRTKAGDTGLIGIPEETNVAYDMAEERYIGTTGRGAEQDTLSTTREIE